MFDYLAFVFAGLPQASNDPFKDGINLANKCIRKLNSLGKNERFPPSLLILLASPAYLQRQKAERLLNGINDTFSDKVGAVNLIGSSVGAVFFDRRIHRNGALLICLASTLIEAKVAYGADARLNPQRAIKELLKNLELDPSKRIDPNPLANRLMITFMPGCNRSENNRAIFPAPELHHLLYEGVQERIWIIGGVSSANLWSLRNDGFQFANRQVLRDSVVAASVITGVPIGVSLNNGLESTKKVLQVTKLARDKKTILEFDGESPKTQLNNNSMLAKLSAGEERIVDIPLPLDDGSVQMLRPLEVGNYFEVFQPTSKIAEKGLNGIHQAKRRVFVDAPVATLLFACNAYNPRTKEGKASANRALIEIEKSLQNGSAYERPCLGGFFDGEIGVDAQGRSRLTNGGVGFLVFGDEIRERTPLYKGVSALAASGHKLLAGSELSREAIQLSIRNAVEIIAETGFPGAMLSLRLSNLDRESDEKKRFIIASETVGARFEKIKDVTKRPFESNDILPVVARDGQARFIPDSRKDPYCDKKAIEASGIISQYVLPLKRLDHSVFGTLQIDLGDLSGLSDAAFKKTEKARMLNCFAEVFSASINRIVNAVEDKIKLKLDKALEKSLAANNFHVGVDKFFRAAGQAFGVEMGHLRLLQTTNGEQPKLILETGFGACYEAEKSKRHEIRADDFSPSSRAFRSKEPHVVNEVSADPAFKEMLRKARHDPKLHEALSQTKSYAAVAFRDGKGKPLGVVSFGSTQPWFFYKLHRAALEALAERLGFLVEHLRTKIARNFLLAVSPKLAKRNLNDAQRIFRSIASDFRRGLNAEASALYLWDKDTGKYVLRAQCNWKDKRWEHAAKYDQKSGWIGVTAVDEEPLYVSDLRKYYLERNYDFPHGRYAEYMFGQPLSDSFTVEAIGLPLRIGPEKENKFGVLTLYRRIKEGQPSGFVTTDIELLQEGAYNAAGLVNAVLWHRKDKWEKQEQYRKYRYHQEMDSGDDRTFEAKICRAVLKSFRATAVDFYRMDPHDESPSYSWIAGYRLGRSSKRPEKLKTPSGDHSEIINQTIQPNKPYYRVASVHHKSKENSEQNPNALKTEGMVEQACIPLIGDKKYVAALVVRWRIGSRHAFSLQALHNPFHLQVLGRTIGSAFSKQLVQKRADRSKQAVHTAGLYVFQHAHKLINAIQVLDALAKKIKSARDEKTLDANVHKLEARAAGYIQTVNWVFGLGELIQNPARDTLFLSLLLKKCWRVVRKSTPLIPKVRFNVDDETRITADPKLVTEVFINLLENAIKAMEAKKYKEGEKSRLEIAAAVSQDQETVRITFKDNGVGMTRRQEADAIRGFKSTDRRLKTGKRKGVGVLISLYLLAVQDGSLKYKTRRFKGTTAIVTLPNPKRKDSK